MVSFQSDSIRFETPFMIRKGSTPVTGRFDFIILSSLQSGLQISLSHYWCCLP